MSISMQSPFSNSASSEQELDYAPGSMEKELSFVEKNLPWLIGLASASPLTALFGILSSERKNHWFALAGVVSALVAFTTHTIEAVEYGKVLRQNRGATLDENQAALHRTHQWGLALSIIFAIISIVATGVLAYLMHRTYLLRNTPRVKHPIKSLDRNLPWVLHLFALSPLTAFVSAFGLERMSIGFTTLAMIMSVLSGSVDFLLLRDSNVAEKNGILILTIYLCVVHVAGIFMLGKALFSMVQSKQLEHDQARGLHPHRAPEQATSHSHLPAHIPAL
eukprot:GDKJ01013643.1.p1 GENE.GDKJ01013643.1~~GDKJ01013643.1.p1  ORF type:complete len:278 (-),score=33.88 GDKJ01013643.1:865-1698(-)